MLKKYTTSCIVPIALILVCVTVLCGCFQQPEHTNPYDPENTSAAPVVVSTSPGSDGVNGNVGMVITARFNTYLDPLSVTPDSVIMYDRQNNRVMGRVSCEGTSVTFTPVIPLFNAHTYSVVLTGVIRGISGIRLASPHTWSFTTAARWIPETLPVPGGTFTMGTAETSITIDDDRINAIPDINHPEGGTLDLVTNMAPMITMTVHEVTVSPFQIGKYEVTFDEYDEFCDSTGRRKPEDYWGRGRMPVVNVTWFDAVEYCNWLSRVRGYDTCYTISGMAVVPDFSRNGYRLPTEAEWEFAARCDGEGGVTPGDAFSGYKEGMVPEPIFDDYVWGAINANSAAHLAGTKLPNHLGIYDMSGNVSEWCWDWYGAYGPGPDTDPTGPENPVSGDNRKVTRGGGYLVDIEFYLTSIRGYQGEIWPNTSAPQGPGSIKVSKDGDLGFRVCRRPYPGE